MRVRLVAAGGFYANEMNPNSKTLCNLNAYPHILITREKDRIRDSLVTPLYEIGDDQRIHPLLPT